MCIQNFLPLNKRPARRGIALLAGFMLLFSAAFYVCADAEEEIGLDELLDISDDEIETVRILLPGESLKMTDTKWIAPSDGSPVQCDHENCYWNLPCGTWDEEAVWKVLTAPVTVLDVSERKQYKVRRDPDKNCTAYTGEVTGTSQAVHVLERGEEWTLIEAYSSSVEGSKVKVWAEKFQGYVETSLLKEVTVDQTYGLVIDKQRQRMFVYKEGRLFTTMLVSTGYYNPGKKNPWNETPAGEFLCVSWTGELKLKDEETGELNMRCRKAIRINDGILVHEVPMIPRTNDDGSINWSYTRCERYLGEKASHGCIRVQQKLTPERVNHEWLWDNLSKGDGKGQGFTKVIIWDDKGRSLRYPDDGLILYYDPNYYASYYHSSPDCVMVKSKNPKEFTYGELEDSAYKKKTACPYCAPEPRRADIDTMNRKNDR